MMNRFGTSAVVFVCVAVSSAWGASATYTFTTLAGTSPGSGIDDGVGSAARFNTPTGVAVDGSGTVYVADSLNYTIRKITPAGAVSTLAGLAGSPGSTDGVGAAARFQSPTGVAVDGSGNLYVTDNDCIRKITPAGAVSTIAGAPGVPGSTDSATAANARFSTPFGLASDTAGNLYVADTGNNTIRMITTAGVVTTLAGSAGATGSANGTGVAASFNAPQGVALFGGNIYVADSGNDIIRQIAPGGVVTTLAGTAGQGGQSDGSGAAATFNHPYGVATDDVGRIYVADRNNQSIRRITGTTVSSMTSSLSNPEGVAVDGSGNIYVADTGNHLIRIITPPSGAANNFAGAAIVYGSADGTGAAAQFFEPEGITVDSSGNVYVGDWFNKTIRKITPGGVVTTFAGTAQTVGSTDGTGAAARFLFPLGVGVDSTGVVYVADESNDTIRKISPAAVVTTLAGTPLSVGSADGTGAAARFSAPFGVAPDSSFNVYVADYNNSTIRKITPAGVVTTIAGAAGITGSTDSTTGTSARFFNTGGVAVDSGGTLFVSDTNNSTIRKITPAGAVSTFAGTAKSTGTTDGTGAAARFSAPIGIAVDGNDNVYVADFENNTIRKITSAAVVTTIAGNGIGGVNLVGPYGVAVDSNANVYVADTGNNCIRVGKPALADIATIDASTGVVGTSRQLGTAPQTATSWTWAIVRQPNNSSATLSSASIQNPTFVPDVPDLFVFRLTATSAAGTSISTVSLTGTGNPIPILATVSPPSATPGAATYVMTLTGANFIASSQVAWTGRANLTPQTQSSNQLTVQIPASYIASGGTPSVAVFNPGPGGGTSAGQTVAVSNAPYIDSANATAFNVGTAGTFTITTTGSPAPAISKSGALPAGVTLVDNGNGTATLSGTPAVGTGAAAYPFTITASNGAGPNAVQSFSLAVNEAPTVTSAAYAIFTEGVAGAFTVTTTGFPKPALSLGGATLPNGVFFADSGNGTGMLQGTPTGTTGGTYALTITAANSFAIAAPQNFTLIVNHAGFEIAPSMSTGRLSCTATLLPNGRVLLAGGTNLNTSEVYDPIANAWSAAANLNAKRCTHSAVLLPNGKVLVMGGTDVSFDPPYKTAEIYDPNANTWTPVASMNTARPFPCATLLNTGKVLVAGGFTQSTGGIASAEVYDPVANTWTNTTNTMSVGRYVATATLLPSGKVLLAGGLTSNSIVTATCDIYDPSTNTFTAAASMANARYNHCATLMANGKVLVASGATGGSFVIPAEIYDPGANSWSPAATPPNTLGYGPMTLLPDGTVLFPAFYQYMSLPGTAFIYNPTANTWSVTSSITAPELVNPTATLLANGKVLIAGGDQTASSACFMYDPVMAGTGTFGATGSLSAARSAQSATLLTNGQVLLAGGFNGSYVSSAELYDPTAGTCAGTGNMSAARDGHTATLLGSGKVLVAGGYNGSYLNGAEVYNSGTWSATGSLTTARSGHTSTLLANGRVLVAGGTNGAALNAAEVYDAGLGAWSPAGSMSNPRCNHTATLLSSGKVLVAGGTSGSGATASAELYDPATNTWSSAGSLTAARQFHSATLLPNGKVLVAGGNSNGSAVATAEVYDPTANAWGSASFLNVPREMHTATLLNGRVLVAGGDTGAASLNTGELYDPVSNTWSLSGNLNAARTGHTATLLLTGSVLLAGGSSGGSALNSAELCADPLNYAAGNRPSITTATTPLPLGGAMALTGTQFKGVSEASYGSPGDSPSNYPLVQLRSVGNDQILSLLEDSAHAWSATSFTSLPIAAAFPGGYARVTVFTNGIPSPSVLTLIETPPTIVSPNAVTFLTGTAGSFTVATAGIPTASIARGGVTLPSGITFVDNGNGTGTLGGTPAAGATGNFALTFTATNAAGSSAAQSFTLAIGQIPAITSATSTTLKAGTSGTFSVTTTGFPTPSIAPGGVALPSGVTFTDNGNGTGTFAGMPAAGTGGAYALTFTATNSAGSSAVQNFTLTVNQAPTMTSAAVTTFIVGTAGTFTVMSAGFPTPSLARGGAALPSGVTFLDNGNGTGTLAGTPSAGTGGAYALTFTATNTVGSSAAQSFTLTVNEAPSITSLANATFMAGSAGTFTVTTIGFPKPSIARGGVALPGNVTFTDNGNGTGTLAGTPGPTSGGAYALTFTATNVVSSSAAQNFTLTVNQAPAVSSASATTFIVGTPGTFTVATTGFPSRRSREAAWRCPAV